MKKIEIKAAKKDKVLNVISYQVAGVNYNAAAKLLRKKDIRVNNVKIGENIYVNEGDAITLFIGEDKLSKHYENVYEDDNIIIVNKKKGIETVGEFGLEGEIRNVLAVHRLDRNTEGLLIFAKSKKVKEELVSVFEKGQIEKYYLAEVIGTPKEREKVLSAYLTKDSEEALVKIHANKKPGSEKIKTGYKVLKTGNSTSILEVRLFTGKTHQIRAHLAYIGHPVLGEGKYAKLDKRFNEKSQKLFSYKIKFLALEGDLNYLSNKEFIIYPSWFKK